MADYLQKYADKTVEQLGRMIERTYRQAAKEIDRKMKSFWDSHKVISEKMLTDVADGKITEQDYKNWLRNQVFAGDRWKAKLDEVTKTYREADEKARKLVGDKDKDVFLHAANWQAGSTSRAVNGAVSFDMYDRKTVDRLLRDDPKMLPEWKINEKKDYIWNEKRVQNAVAQGIIQGESVYDIGKRLTNDLSASNASKMDMFARTAVTGAQNAGRIERLHEAEEMGIKVKKKWLSAHDDRVRDTHADLDGQEVDVDKPFVIDDKEIGFPGDPSCPYPELVYNCRCTLIYVYPEYQKKQDEVLDTQENNEKTDVADEKRWHSKEEYDEARANKENVYEEERKRAEEWYDSECDRVLDEEFDGGDFTSQRIAIRKDDTLTEAEKEERLKEIEEKREKWIERRNEIAAKRDEKIKEALDKRNTTFDPDYEYKKIQGEVTLEEQIKAVNPHYFEDNGYQVNCQSCGVAYELRSRGYDVEATWASNTRGLGAESNIVYAFGKAELSLKGTGHGNTVAVRNQMLEWGDGSRAIISIDRDNGAGHIFNAAVVDGHFVVIDSQLGIFFTDTEVGDKIYGLALEGEGTIGFSLYRTDNKPMRYVPENWVKRK